MTEEVLDAQRYRTRMRGLELKKRLATLESRLQELGDVWRKLGDTFRDCRNNTFQVSGGNDIEVFRPNPEMRQLSPNRPPDNKIASASLRDFDGEALIELLTELERAKDELRQIKRLCAEMGDPL